MKEKILIIDDSRDIRILLAHFLKAAGYEIAQGEDGEHGLKLAREWTPDLILLDVVMPGIDGYKVCEILKGDAATQDIPVVFLSARSDAADKIKGLDIGGSDYITKPFDRGEVMARIENLLKIRRLTHALLKANADLTEKQRHLDEDLKAAAAIQQSLLPQKLPQFEQLDIAWKFMPSAQIGGDIFNALPLDDHHLAFYMIDVSGHGVPAALVTFSVSQALQPHMGYTVKKKPGCSPDHEIMTPREVMEALDSEYPWERFEKYLTVIYLIVDLREGKLIYSNAAHPPPMLLRADGSFDLLEKGGTIIGLDGILPYEEQTHTLQEGDKILFYTDGVLDVMNAHGERFGEKRFYDLARSLSAGPVSAIVEETATMIHRFADAQRLPDDVSLLGVGFKKRKR